MTQGLTWFSRAGLKSGPPVLRLAEELETILILEGYAFWEKLQLWIEKNTPLLPAVTQVQRRWFMMLYPMMGRPVEVVRDEMDIRLTEISFNSRRTLLKVGLETARGRNIFVAELLLLAQVPLKVHATRSKSRRNAARGSRTKPGARGHVLG